jgi:hypothetical protein
VRLRRSSQGFRRGALGVLDRFVPAVFPSCPCLGELGSANRGGFASPSCLLSPASSRLAQIAWVALARIHPVHDHPILTDRPTRRQRFPCAQLDARPA